MLADEPGDRAEVRRAVEAQGFGVLLAPGLRCRSAAAVP
jgi:hypothetical protein